MQELISSLISNVSTMDIENVKVTVKQISGWDRAKECALQTIGKKMVNLPDADWERKMLLSEHAPIRAVEYDIKIDNVPYYVVMHIVRHHIGIEKYVTTQRDDRTEHTISRAQRPQGQLVSVLLSFNAQSLINISLRRLCNNADADTIAVWSKVREEIRKTDPIMADFMVRQCVYRGACTEVKCCGFFNTPRFLAELMNYQSLNHNLQ